MLHGPLGRVKPGNSRHARVQTGCWIRGPVGAGDRRTGYGAAERPVGARTSVWSASDRAGRRHPRPGQGRSRAAERGARTSTRHQGDRGRARSGAIRRRPGKEIEIQYPGDDTRTVCIGEGDRVGQIRVNLLFNPVKCTVPGGEILITCGTTRDVDSSAVVSEEKTYVRVQANRPGLSGEFVT